MAAVFEHNDRLYRDCWIETSVPQAGQSPNGSGLYVAGHYQDYASAGAALADLRLKHPAAVIAILMEPAPAPKKRGTAHGHAQAEANV